MKIVPLVPRKALLAIAVMALCAPLCAEEENNTWRQDGKPAADTPNMKSKDGFGAQLLLVEGKQFFEDWSKPETPNITPVKTAYRNVPIFTVVLFSDPGLDASGSADVTCDFVIRKPDGSIYGGAEQKGEVVWKGKFKAPPHYLQLSMSHMGIQIDPPDPVGTYTVDVTLHDKIKKVDLSLTTTFDVVQPVGESEPAQKAEPAGKVEKVDRAVLMPVAEAMMKFPENPTESAFHAIEAQLNAIPKWNESDDESSSFFLCSVFLAAAHERYGWPISDQSQFGLIALAIASGKGDLARYVKDDDDVDPSKLDIWWMSYFASQDEKYLTNLLKYAGNSLPKGNADQMVLIGAATWSFKSNCQQSPSVRAFARRCLVDPAYADKKAFLQECVDQKK